MKAKEAKMIAQNLLACTAETIAYELGDAIDRGHYDEVDDSTDAEIKKVQKALIKLVGWNPDYFDFSESEVA